MKLHEAVAVTYAAIGQEINDAALSMICIDLKDYPLDGVLISLTRCRKELKRICLSDILERIPGGHPGAEEAWSIVSPALNDERITLVMTEEIQLAFGAALSLNDDPIAARMAFKEVYTRAVAESMSQNNRPRWMPSLGWDVNGRVGPIMVAVEKGRLTNSHAAMLLPKPENVEISGRIRSLTESKRSH